MSTSEQNLDAAAVRRTLELITAAWRAGRSQEMASVLDEQVVMAFPGFVGFVEGRQALIDSFVEFAREAQVHDYRQGEVRVDGSGDVAVAQHPFEMIYERDGSRWHSTGWDVWVFRRQGTGWLAVWRTMQALAESRV